MTREIKLPEPALWGQKSGKGYYSEEQVRALYSEERARTLDTAQQERHREVQPDGTVWDVDPTDMAQQECNPDWPTMPPRKGQSHVLFDDGYEEGWAKCIEACKAAVLKSQQERKPDAYIRKDQLEKAKVSAMLCEVTQEPRADRIAIYTTPAAQQERNPDMGIPMSQLMAEIERLTRVIKNTPEVILKGQERKPEQCEWKPEDPDFMPGTYASACGELWSFIDGGPNENRVRFCHGCGKPVALKETP